MVLPVIYALVILYLINLAFTFCLLYLEKKNLSVALAWIPVILVFPVLGFLLYFILGSTYKINLVSQKYKMNNIEMEYKEILNNIRNSLDDRDKAESYNKEYENLVTMNSTSMWGTYVNGNKVKIFDSAQKKYDDMFKEIDKAKRTIYIEYYIFKTKDEIGKKLLALLEKKAKEGIEIKIIYDVLASRKTRYKDFNELIANGVKVEKYLASKIKNLFLCNYRLHRKLVIIDGDKAYTGGINIGDDYLGKKDKVSPWRDTAIRIDGNAAKLLELRFYVDWDYCLRCNKHNEGGNIDIENELDLSFNKLNKGESAIQTIFSSIDSNEGYIKNSYSKIITDAKEYLYIETPYLSPDETILDSLKIAVLSGVDVRIIIPGVPDKKTVYKVTLSYSEELIKAGVKLYMYNGFIHSKSMVSDDKISNMGTCNIDFRSFVFNYEDNIVIYSKDIAKQNKQIFINDMNNSVELKLEDINKKGALHNIKQTLLRVFAPLV